MDDKKETEEIVTQNLDAESLENPFNKLAPEVVAHILSFLTDIPSKMSANGVCRLWRKLVDWKEVKLLQLDFEQNQLSDVPIKLHINKVPFPPSKFSTALESLLRKVKLTSLQVLLPTQSPSKPSKPGLYLRWPLYLLDCGVAVNQLTNQQAASLSHITHVCISGRPDNPEFEFVCHLLELCPSLIDLNIKLNNDKFGLGLLKSALTNKRLVELNITLSHLTGLWRSSEHFAQLCQVLAPGTLKSITLDLGGEDATDHYGLIFLDFCLAFHNNAGCLSALEHLAIATPSLNPPGIDLDDANQVWTFTEGVSSMVNIVLPKLQKLEFTSPNCDPSDWLLLEGALLHFSDAFKRPLHVSLLTNHCTVFELFVVVKLNKSLDPQYFLDSEVTEQGFKCFKVQGEETPIEFEYKRQPIGATACDCHVCQLEYGWVKQQLINRFNGVVSKDELRVFACQIPYLQVDLMDQFPSLSMSQVQNGSVKIKVEGKSEFKAAVIAHKALSQADICAGCAMLPYPQ